MDQITITDIAKMCGVGVTTVSRAINNHPDINSATKARILEVIKQTNYVPNNSARNLKRSESKTIAVLIKGITNPFFNPIISILEKEIKKRKHSFLLHKVEETEDEIGVAIELIKEKRLTGIIFLGGNFLHNEEKLQKVTVPFVLSTIGLAKGITSTNYSTISVDDFSESYKMVDYLCSLGHKKIAILTTSMDDISIGKLRYEGYKQALKDNNIEYCEKLVRPTKETNESYGMKSGYKTTLELLKSEEEFTALYAISDRLAVGACRALIDAGKQIPEDYSVAGFDGIDISEYYNPSITTIRQPAEQIAQESISILFKMINKEVTNYNKIFRAELVVRESTGTCQMNL